MVDVNDQGILKNTSIRLTTVKEKIGNGVKVTATWESPLNGAEREELSTLDQRALNDPLNDGDLQRLMTLVNQANIVQVHHIKGIRENGLDCESNSEFGQRELNKIETTYNYASEFTLAKIQLLVIEYELKPELTLTINRIVTAETAKPLPD